MMIYPELLLELAHDRRRELVAEADRARLLKSARQWARARKAAETTTHTASHATGRTNQGPARATVVVNAARSRGDGSVTTCVPRAAAPAGR